MQNVTRKACFVAKNCIQCGLHGPQPQEMSGSSNSVWRLFDLSSWAISLPFSPTPISWILPFCMDPLLLCCCCLHNKPLPFVNFDGMMARTWPLPLLLPFPKIWVPSSPAIVFDCYDRSVNDNTAMSTEAPCQQEKSERERREERRRKKKKTHQANNGNNNRGIHQLSLEARSRKEDNDHRGTYRGFQSKRNRKD